MKLTRRKLLSLIGASTFTSLTILDISLKKSGFLLGWENHVYFFYSDSYVSRMTGIGIWSLKLGSKPHDFIRLDKNRALSIPKWGESIALIDLSEKKLIKEFSLKNSHKYAQFMGHGAFDKKEQKIYISTIFFNNHNLSSPGIGLIKVYDSLSLQEIDEFPSFGVQPHECLLHDDSRLIVLNTGISQSRKGANPSISIINIKTKKLEKSLEVPVGMYFSHFEKINPTHYFLCNEYPEETENNRIAPYIFSMEEGFSQFDDIGKFDSPGILLTPALIKDKGLVAVSIPDKNMVTFWNTSTGKHYSSIELPDPGAISYKAEEESLIVATKLGIVTINTQTMSIETVYDMNFGEGLSSHGLWI